jgi:hypothetical protein
MLAITGILSGGAYAAADPTMHQVYQAAENGRMTEAQQMMEQVLRDHPKSAKAHYVEAELMAKKGRLAEGRTELTRAEELAPGLPFATPHAVQTLRARLSGLNTAAQAPARPTRFFPGDQFPWTLVFLGVGFLIVLLVATRLMTRRSARPAVGTSGSGSPMQPNGTSGASPMRSGIGSGILGGLATGAAVGAGMVAGEELMHHVLNGHSDSAGVAPLADADELIAPPDDMGGQDFGISDDSWDDGSSLDGDDWS